MIVANPFACDVCKVQKKEVNEWYLVFPVVVFDRSQLYDVGFKINDDPTSETFNGSVLIKWDDELARNPRVKHACGLPHALQLLNTQHSVSEEREECTQL